MSYDPHQQPPQQPYSGPPQQQPYPQGYGQPYGQTQYGQPQYGVQPGYPPPPPAKKPRRWPVIVGVGALLLVSLCLIGATLNNESDKKSKAGVTTTAAAKPGKTTAKDDTDSASDSDDGPANFSLKPGTIMTITGDDGNVQEAAIVSFKVRKSSCNSFGGEPKNGSFLVADVRVTQKKGTGAVNPLFFTWVGEDGTTSSAIDGAFSGCATNTLDSTNALRAGTKRAGQMVFDVSSSGGTVEYAPGGLGSEAVGSWKTK
jgi:hypothetical protein